MLGLLLGAGPARPAPWLDGVVREALGPVERDESLARAATRWAAGPGHAEGEAARVALRTEGLADPEPFLVILSAGPGADDAALSAALTERTRGRRLTHFGAARRGAELHLVLVERRVALGPLSRRVRGAFVVRGRRLAPGSLAAFETLPDGDVRALPVTDRGDGLAVEVPCADEPGPHVFELVQETPLGPRVVALWPFVVGDGEAAPPEAYARDAAALRRSIAALRRVGGREALVEDPRLAEAASRQARRICALGRALHVPEPGDTPERRAAAVGYRGPLAENLAVAESVEACDRQILESPSHRGVRLWSEAARFGVAVEQAGSRVCVAEVYGR